MTSATTYIILSGTDEQARSALQREWDHEELGLVRDICYSDGNTNRARLIQSRIDQIRGS